MKYAIILSAISIIILLLSACDKPTKQFNDYSNKENKDNHLNQTDELIEEKTSQINQTYKGTGSKVVKIKLNKGLVIFSINYSGKGYFGVELKDYDGENLELLANEVIETNNFSSSKSFKVKKSSDYLLEVSSNGNWSITTSD